MSSLDAIWTLEQSPDLTEDERADAIASIKAGEWSALTLPITVGTVTVSSVSAHGPVVTFEGEGGTVDWPLQLINAPIAVRDNTSTDVDANGIGWRVDCAAVLTDILGRFQ